MSLIDRHQSITIRGIVCHSDWDDDARASQVSIFTFDDDEYVVAPEDEGEFLLHRTGVEVMAKGHLLSEDADRKVIRITSLTVFGSMANEFSEPDDELVGIGTVNPSMDGWAGVQPDHDETR